MFSIEWKPNGSGKWYYNHEKYMFKKEQLGSGHIYKIYKHEELMYNTNYEHEFKRRARHVVDKGRLP